MAKLLKPILFKYKGTNDKIYPARITGVYSYGIDKGNYITFDIYYNEKMGWKEVKNEKIQKEQYLKNKSKL
jgi:hypothetical protein